MASTYMYEYNIMDSIQNIYQSQLNAEIAVEQAILDCDIKQKTLESNGIYSEASANIVGKDGKTTSVKDIWHKFWEKIKAIFMRIKNFFISKTKTIDEMIEIVNKLPNGKDCVFNFKGKDAYAIKVIQIKSNFYVELLNECKKMFTLNDVNEFEDVRDSFGKKLEELMANTLPEADAISALDITLTKGAVIDILTTFKNCPIAKNADEITKLISDILAGDNAKVFQSLPDDVKNQWIITCQGTLTKTMEGYNSEINQFIKAMNKEISKKSASLN